ncbi:MAG TPA: carboxypeptidase regulatory-like domain-containing protein [Pyrinomonadaceae bacterium]|jgi:plastocyanin|nr:carboxypeptidase regulatory-like domain-containing protein [Pyrinomonadaceae bacterium]
MQSNRARFLAALLAALCVLALSMACSKGLDDEEDGPEGAGGPETDVATTPYKPSGQEGSIAGTITFAGAAPAPRAISMDQDPVCAGSNPNAAAEDIVVNGDKLQNVFVYVKEGKIGDKSVAGFSFPAPAQPAVLDQHGCRYVPHVMGVQANQKISVTNSDATSHNVNAQAEKNQKFNQGQGPGAAPIEKTFTRAETLIPVKCNQHPWMRAYVGVLSHPFFAVTDKDGHFEIKGVPAGTYTLVAWHEKYPTGITQTVTVGPSESKQQNFSFTGEQLKAESVEGGALKVMPAIEFPMIGMHH